MRTGASRNVHTARKKPIRLALAAGGTALLGIAWLTGGSLLFVPVGTLALLMLVAAVLLQWRAWPAAALLFALVALAGMAPAGSCTFDPWSDALTRGDPAADARAEAVTIAEAGLHGPRWSSGGGFSGEIVHCPARVVGLGGAWALGLSAIAAFTTLRGERSMNADAHPRA